MVSMDYKGKNFDINRVQQYAAMRVVMAENMMKKILVSKNTRWWRKDNARTQRTKR